MDYKILNELIDDVDKYKAHKKPKNEKDKNALICAKQMIKDFVISNNNLDNFHLFAMALSQTDGTARLDINKISKNIYTLKKLNK